MRFSKEKEAQPELVINLTTFNIYDVSKAREKDSKDPSVIERLRAKYPNGDLVKIAVAELFDPAEMKRFVFEYANDLKQNSPFRDSQRYPFEWAVGIIKGTAEDLGGEAIERWDELFTTGTLQNPRDTSLDWITKSGTQAIAEERAKNRNLTLQKRPRNIIEFSRIQRNASGKPLVSSRSASALQQPKR